MFTKSNLDFSSAEAFILSVLPWLEKETGLKAETGKLPLPFPVIVTENPIIVGYDHGEQSAAGLYDHIKNELYIVASPFQAMEYTSSIAVHEMVHWLQNANGWLKANPSEGKPREVVEKLAYETQYKFLNEVMAVPPEMFGMTKERIAEVLESERLQGISLNQGNVRSNGNA